MSLQPLVAQQRNPMIQQCQSCQTGSALNCAAVWKYDLSILACLRLSEKNARLAGRSEIEISDFLLACCHHEHVAVKLNNYGARTQNLERELSRLAGRQSQATGNGRVVLSAALNALLIASEEGARLAGVDEVSLDGLFATLAHNASHDPAAHIFAQHATALTTMPVQSPSQQNTTGRAVGFGRDRVRNNKSHPTLAYRQSESGRGASSVQDNPGAHRRTRERYLSHADQQAHNRALYDHNPGRVSAADTNVGLRHVSREYVDHPRTQAMTNAAVRESSERDRESRRMRDDNPRTGRAALSSSHQTSELQYSRDGARSAAYENTRMHTASTRRRPEDDSKFYDTVLSLLRAQEQRLERLETARTQTLRKRIKLKRIGSFKTSSKKQSAQSRSRSERTATQSTSRDSTRTGLITSATTETSESSTQTRSAATARQSRQRSSSSSGSSHNGSRSQYQSQSDSGRRGERTWDERERAPYERRDSDQNRWEGREPRTRYLRAEGEERSGRSSSERSARRARAERGGDTAARQTRFYLSLDDDLVDAPSIGPKTAARFTPLGIHTVRDFLECDVEDTASRINVRHITADVLRDWQHQARLVCTIPFLRGTHAQLLVGADYRDAQELAAADLGEVLAGILRFATTKQGERVLRSNAPPERDKVATWLKNAKQADMGRVA